jgi:cytochrome b561
MTEPTAHPHSGADADRHSPPGMPRWVKAAAIVGGVLIVLVLVLQLTGIGGEHGPGRHMSGSGAPVENVIGAQAAVATGIR